MSVFSSCDYSRLVWSTNVVALTSSSVSPSADSSAQRPGETSEQKVVHIGQQTEPPADGETIIPLVLLQYYTQYMQCSSLMCVCVAQCEVGALCSVKKGPRFGQLCDCHKGSRCNYVFLKCLWSSSPSCLSSVQSMILPCWRQWWWGGPSVDLSSRCEELLNFTPKSI